MQVVVYKYNNSVVKTIFGEIPPSIGDKIIVKDSRMGPITLYRVVDRVLELGCEIRGLFYPTSGMWIIYLEKGFEEEKRNID